MPTDRRPTALITGASAGIGNAFARRLAADGYDLTLVARDEARLAQAAAELTAAHGVTVDVLPADLATDAGAEAVGKHLANPPDLLVNNAGVGVRQTFLRSDGAEEARQLRLNVEAVMRLTHAALPAMTQRRHGAIVNVSSVAGFGPVQPGSTYSATKAWVTNFSESVGQQARRYGVRVMALCPGFTRTEFQERAGIDTSGSPDWMWLKADDVVNVALRDLARGRLVSVPDWKYKTAVFAIRHLPRPLLYRAAGGTRHRVSPPPQ
ncbi:SDR family NAD(P)-dependent oxidoreductase [Spirilliplanes yamanashiensis]|uniref:Dehydrogenase n=1 Tax=Spirilliplanes yamanashiensis TaxID=42233 RepID=A0A8J3Y7I2_9ACTN|nr:SDR family oxidoreductase [Spirilliplanes yamanashiensis]MDP9815084.1 short-subunit dehydrogenase [Spirilliplanes yamanashiensis]GIJ02740.1 dehydrogenase [Spirilliplanes yamanashiensis]